ncbi:MAG: molybdate ABC transporter substrate-binding protein [Psychroserpens sp.]|nr:molybdate ABC transporter substrate-binding protein [Psychroserpens sp.]
MKIILTLFAFVLLNTSGNSQNINVATSANLQFTMKEIVAEFERENDIKVSLIIGSSGKLTAQIINGAPYHIFLSADTKYADFIYEEGLALGLPKVYASGSLILWTYSNFDVSKGLKCLSESKINTIAIASPKTAPYGKLAIKALKENKLLNEINDKLIYANSIAQVNQYISLNAVDVGLSSKSSIYTPTIEDKGKWKEIESYAIEQAMVRLSFSKENAPKSTEKFYTFLSSKTAKHIFAKHGYIIN